MKQKLKIFLREITILFISTIALAIVMRIFLFSSIIKIPSPSMEPAILAGDFIIANKQIPGPRIFKNLRQIRIDGKVQTKRFNPLCSLSL